RFRKLVLDTDKFLQFGEVHVLEITDFHDEILIAGCTGLPEAALNSGTSRSALSCLGPAASSQRGHGASGSRPGAKRCSHDGMVFCLGRRSARAHAAEMVIGWALGTGGPSGCHCPFRAERCGGAFAAR